MPQDARGSTLLELMMVVMLLTLLAGASFKVISVADRTGARLAAYQLATDVMQAQQQAIASGLTCSLRPSAPFDQQQQPAWYSLRCRESDGATWAFRPDVSLGREVRLQDQYYWNYPPVKGKCLKAGSVMLGDDCYEPKYMFVDNLSLDFLPSGLREGSGKHTILILKDRAGTRDYWVRVRAVTGEVQVLSRCEPTGVGNRIQCG